MSSAYSWLHFPGSSTQRVDFVLKLGFAAKDYTRIAKKEHLKPLEVCSKPWAQGWDLTGICVQVDMLKMEDAVKEIHEEMKYMREVLFVCCLPLLPRDLTGFLACANLRIFSGRSQCATQMVHILFSVCAKL
jgi:hypothetical protein